MKEPTKKKPRTSQSKGKRPMVTEEDPYFSESRKADRVSMFEDRKIEKHKVIDLTSFLDKGFVFPRWLIDQHLETFCGLGGNIYPKLVREFYANLIKRKEVWITEVRNLRISVTTEALGRAAALQNEGELFFDLSHNEWEDFNATRTFLDSMRPGKRFDGKLMNAGLLKVNDRLLHYMLVYILLPRLNNKAQLTSEDLKFMYALKSGLQINWADVVLGHMTRRFKEEAGVLPYPALVSKLCVNAGVDVTNEAKLCLKKGSEKIDSLTLKKMKIVRVEGVWNWLEDTLPGAQDDIAEDVHEEVDVEIEVPDQTQSQGSSLEDAVSQMQDFMREQFLLLRNEVSDLDKKLEEVKERLASVNALIESVVASKEKASPSVSKPNLSRQHSF